MENLANKKVILVESKTCGNCGKIWDVVTPKAMDSDGLWFDCKCGSTLLSSLEAQTGAEGFIEGFSKVTTSLGTIMLAFFSWVFTGVMIYGLFVVLTGCGSADEYMKWKKIEEENKTSGVQAEEPAEETDEEEPEFIAQGDEGERVEVNVQVNVEINEAAQDAPEWLLDTREVTHAEAIENTPDGYHLATRAELFELLDSGDLDEYIDDQTGIWTDTDDRYSSEMAIVLSLSMDFSAMKTLDFNAVYIVN